MNPVKTTPMIKQYLSIKEKYSDAILFYRMGDFYEMFFEDAETASKILEITLTSRNKKDKHPIPMCGIPYKAAHRYLSRLLEQGHKVAICDQIENPGCTNNNSGKRLVKREVVRVITPGTIIENDLLDEKTNNYILSVACLNNSAGISYLDISTGTFRLSETKNLHSIIDEVMRVSPSEAILPKGLETDPFFMSVTRKLNTNAVTFIDDKAFEYHSGRQRLLDQFQTISLEGFGCENLKAGISAAGALLSYVNETQKQKTAHISNIETYTLENFLLIDEITCENLELIKNLHTGTRHGTLLSILDKTVTSMGGRLLKRWLRYPLCDFSQIKFRQDAVKEAKENVHARNSIRESLKSVYDLERLGSKISMGHANARDLVALKNSLKVLPEIWSYLSGLKASAFKKNDAFDFDSLTTLIEKAILEEPPPYLHEGGIIKTGYSTKLDEFISITRNGKDWIAKLELKEREKTGINTLKVRYNKVFGYYIEVPKARSGEVADNYIRKQTLVNAERYITDELKSFELDVLNAQEKRTALEFELFNEIREKIIKQTKEIKETAGFIAVLDSIMGIAETADQNDYVLPEINTQGSIVIQDGRHPVVEKMIAGERYVPNSISMDGHDSQILIITGPNMAGKSTVLRQTALIVLMAQIGSFVPAKKASISITDRIFTRVGALDNLAAGQSTFLVEMQETAKILNNATPQSLVILDEIGRGTSTFDGMSIAWAVAEYLHEIKGTGVKTLFATHYHELTELALTKPRVKNFNIAVKEWNDEIIFLRKMIQGSTNRSYGIQVARLAGVPDNVIKRAKQILVAIEKGEHSPNAIPAFAVDDAPEKRGQKQLGLFDRQEHPVVNKLRKIDILKITPLEALNILNELQEKAKTVLV